MVSQKSIGITTIYLKLRTSYKFVDLSMSVCPSVRLSVWQITEYTRSRAFASRSRTTTTAPKNYKKYIFKKKVLIGKSNKICNKNICVDIL